MLGLEDTNFLKIMLFPIHCKLEIALAMNSSFNVKYSQTIQQHKVNCRLQIVFQDVVLSIKTGVLKLFT